MPVFAQHPDALKEGFMHPPSSAWPRTWWHWVNGNVTKEGITKDLEWMKRSGIAGFQLADVAFGSGQEVDEKLVFGSPEWLDAVRHAATEAERLDLEMAIFSSPGWSLTGGPWVEPQQAMKKLVWSEMEITGSRRLSITLPKPPSHEGPGPNYPDSSREGGFYRDHAVIAFPTPNDEGHAAGNLPKVSSNRGEEDGAVLLDNNLATALTVKPSGDHQLAWIQLAYEQPFQAKAITIGAPQGIPFGRVMASDDGRRFKTIAVLPGKSGYRGGKIRTYAFPETNARYYRIEFTHAAPSPAEVISEATTAVDTVYSVGEIQLHSGARINRWEDKAGFNFLFEYGGVTTPEIPTASAINPDDVINLTSNMDANGKLNWDAPEGSWTIMRFGYALTGAKNRPAVPAGHGYEVDKMNPKHVEAYFRNYTSPLAKALGDLYGERLQYVLMDSWEAGIQNWTDIMPEEFEKRRGYNIQSFLPALAGKVVGDVRQSERFLWDFRRTLVDLIAENHYGTATDFLNEQGIQTYSEAGGVSLESIEDALLNKKYVDIPMGEFWVRDLHPSSMYYEDVRGAASAGHIYGKPIVAAEAFTGGNYESPRTLGSIGDYWFTQGINRLVFHTSTHQPLDTKPGNAMVGTHFHRNITWADYMKPLTTYFARNSFMLQQGDYVADVAYLLNEGAPATMPFWGGGLQPAMPAGYSFDYVNADVLINDMQVNEAGKIELSSGMQYAVLVLPQTDLMTVRMAEKLQELVAAGATILGPRPTQSPSLTDYPKSDHLITELAYDVWGDLDGVSRTIRSYGKGTVCWGLPLDDVLDRLGVARDVDVNRNTEELTWIHRRDGTTDIYFLVNRTNKPLAIDANFRVSGKDVELWYADNGSIEPAAYRIAEDRTHVSLQLAEHEAVFVVFRNEAVLLSRDVADRKSVPFGELNEGWDLHFQSGLGAPDRIELPQLMSWTAHPDKRVKYFSGTGTYTKIFEVDKSKLRPDQRLLLNLGQVNDMAEVYVNEERVGFLWKAPFEVDVTEALKEGDNQLEVRVTNQWVNRLIGDMEHPNEPVLQAASSPFRRRYVLNESGLIGPVTLQAVGGVAGSQNAPSATVAGIPVNYDETAAGSYSLPDPLTLENGLRVNDTATWLNLRRPELLKLHETHQFGKMPPAPEEVQFHIHDNGTPVFDNTAIRKQVTVYLTEDSASHKVDVLFYLPTASDTPCPLLLNLSFATNENMADDPGVRPGKVWTPDGKRILSAPSRFRKLDIQQFIAARIGVATLCYTDIEPDFKGGIAYGIRSAYLPDGVSQPAPDEWGAISAWAWGLGRVMDYIETDGDIDADRVAITGASRLGKTVLWAGATDSRFAMVIASISGEGGAALSRRNFGETVKHITDTSRYFYQFAANYHGYGDRVAELPVDGHTLISLIAPRPLLLQTGNTDFWSDPKGEFLAALAAEPVYRLFGKRGPQQREMPHPGQTDLLNELGYFMHDGGHTVLPVDWHVFIAFMKKYL